MKKRINNAKLTIKDFFRNIIKVLRRPDMVILPGNLSFFFVLAIIPCVSLISYGASVLNLSADYLYDFIANSFSQDIANLVLGVNLNYEVGIHFFITVAIGFYIASNGADSIITTSNKIYDIENNNWFRRRLKAIGMSILIVLLFIFMLIVPVFGNTIISLVKEVNLNSHITNQIMSIFDLIEGPLTWLIIFIIIKIIYKIAPDKKPKGRVINYGALFATVGFVVGTKIFSIYVTNYANFSHLYGGLASIVVLMLWMYYLAYIFVVGMALNSQKDDDNLSKNGTIK